MSDLFLSVIVPAFNEQENIGRGVLEVVYTYLKNQDYSWELVLVDDGSTDETLPQLKDFAAAKDGVVVLSEPHRGKAGTVIAGMTQAQGLNRLYADLDQSTPIESVEKLLKYRENGFDICIGSREVAGASREKEPVYRHLMGRVFNVVVQLFAVRGLKDTQCGFKLFSKEAVEAVFPFLVVTTGAKRDAFTGAFDVELLYLARKKGLKIAEVPVRWKHMQTVRVSPLKDSVRMFLEVIRIRWADLTGRYEHL